MLSEDFPAFRAGALLAGKYRLETRIGAGGMAVVFLARDQQLDRQVAVKILDPARASDPAFRRRFIAESRAAAKVNDPHVITVYEAGEADGLLFIAMRFANGGDLRKVLSREGALPAERAMEFISPVATALDAAHAAGLVHRDVKPANILIDEGPGRPDYVFLSDFGIAKTAEATVTTIGRGVTGTLDYVAPEQIDGKVDGRTDQYALACVAYHLLTGVLPFGRDDPIAVVVAHLYADPPSLLERRRDLHGTADKVLRKAMAKAPDQRYPSCGEFADALRHALGLGPYRSIAFAPAQDAEIQSGSAARRRGADGDTETLPPGRARPDQVDRARPGSVRRTWRASQQVARTAALALAVVVVVGSLVTIAIALWRHTPSAGTNQASVANLASPTAFVGYPRELGTVAVSSIAPGGGTQVAVGQADGRLAIWRRGAGGYWTLVSARSPAVRALRGTLTSVAHSPNGGWIAVGNVISGTGTRPVAFTSPLGVNWRVSKAPFMALPQDSDPYLAGVAAGPDGYVAVGSQLRGSTTIAAMWWSANLKTWAPENNGNLYGPATSEVDAVAATRAGFVAVGSHVFTDGAVWTSRDGQGWSVHNIGRQASDPGVLRLISVHGSLVVAGGDSVTSHGNAPIVEVSADGGATWQPTAIVLGQAPGSSVTALTSASSYFVAAGQLLRAGHPRAVTWRLPDSLAGWPQVIPAKSSPSVTEITALFLAGQAVSGAGQPGETTPIVRVPG